jgi:predicted component of type VI protein secretion system
MKLSLVVKAAGPQEGKVLPIPLSQFVIGRDPQCHLRPASPMISKRHCAIVQRDGKVFIQDFGSTNGTSVNDQPVKNEIELHNSDKLKIGPLHFEVRIVQDAPAAKGGTPKPPTRNVGAKPAPAKTAAKAAPAKTPDAAAKTHFEMPAAVGGGTDDDDIAAMLMSLNDDDASMGADSVVPDGSTVMEMIAPLSVQDAAKQAELEKSKEKEKEKPKASGNTSNAAKSILEQYMRRPRG